MYLQRKQKNKLVALFCLTYMVSYMTRINYGAVISEMERDTGMSRALLSMSLTGSFITYGVGQIVSGICGDRYSPKKLVSFGLLTTVLMNGLLPFCHTPWQMLILWCINGFAQAFMWPPIMKLMISLLSPEDYSSAVTKVTFGASFGTVAIYLAAPLLILTASWKLVFWFCCLCGLTMLLLWNKLCPDEAGFNPGIKKKTVSKEPLFTPMFLGIMTVIVIMGILRDGITTWMPSYISETFRVSNLASILSGAVMPVFSIACVAGASFLYQKYLRNPLSCAGVLFSVGTLASLGMLPQASPLFSIAMMAVLTGCMHGVSTLLTGMVPLYFSTSGNASTVSGILNACTYIGSACSSYGIALLTECFGWNAAVIFWIASAAIATALCFVNVRPMKNRIR